MASYFALRDWCAPFRNLLWIIFLGALLAVAGYGLGMESTRYESGSDAEVVTEPDSGSEDGTTAGDSRMIR